MAKAKKTLSENAKIIQIYATNNSLEIIFSEGHHLYDKIFYDSKEGKYYNRETDLFLSESELPAFGLGMFKWARTSLQDRPSKFGFDCL